MKCFYHSADLDGHCSGAIVKQNYPECKMIGINYGDAFPWESIEDDELVFMVDFTLQPFDDMEKLNEICSLHWIDHHKTAIDEAFKRGFLPFSELLNVNKSACELTWIYFHGNTVSPPTAVFLLGRYDVWDHTDPRVLSFQYGMRQFVNTQPDNQEFWNELFASKSLCERIIDNGSLLLNYEKSQDEKFCRAYAFETELQGMKAICANRGFCNSRLFESVYDPDKHQLMITFVWKPTIRKWLVSLYSTRDDVDCGFIAASFGGGGHKGAAGFQCDELPFVV